MKCYNLINRAVIAITGSDARSFLQGLVTNDINKVSSDSFLYAMMLSPQGKFLYDFFIIEQSQMLLIDCQASRREEIIKKLSMYKLRAKVEIKPIELKVYAASEALNNNFKQDPRNEKLGYRALSSTLPGECSDFNEYELQRISLLIPDADADFIYDKSFPLEFGANALNAIDYKKGCYIGQELTARTQYRGVIRKCLQQVVYSADAYTKGQEITNIRGEKIGIALGSIGNTGLALVNIEAMKKTDELTDLRFV